MSLDTVLKCIVAVDVIWVCRVVTAKALVRAPQTHVIRRCAVDDLRPASYCSSTYVWLPCSKQGYHGRSECSDVP